MLVTVHLALVFGTIFAVLYSDEQAFLWLIGEKKTLSPRAVKALHLTVSCGLGLLIATGGLLYIRAPEAYLSNPTFIVKMTAVAALIVNTYAIERLSPIAVSRPYSSLSSSERSWLFASGAVSVLGWGAAALCGYLIG